VVRGGEVAARSIGSEEKEAEVVGDGRGSQEEARVNLLRAGERDRGAIGGLDEERELPAHTMDKRRLLRREQIKELDLFIFSQNQRDTSSTKQRNAILPCTSRLPCTGSIHFFLRGNSCLLFYFNNISKSQAQNIKQSTSGNL
jgi:hypothetical protein